MHEHTTIIIPVLNEEKTLPNILKRVFASRYSDTIFVVDDGSTDRSLDIAKKVCKELSTKTGKPSKSCTTNVI